MLAARHSGERHALVCAEGGRSVGAQTQATKSTASALFLPVAVLRRRRVEVTKSGWGLAQAVAMLQTKCPAASLALKLLPASTRHANPANNTRKSRSSSSTSAYQ